MPHPVSSILLSAFLTISLVSPAQAKKINKSARDRSGAIKLDVGGAFTDGLGLEVEFGRDLSLVVRGKYLGGWPHLHGAWLYLGGTVLSVEDEDDPELLHMVGGGAGIQWSWADYDESPTRVYQCQSRKQNCSLQGVISWARTWHLRLITDYMRVFSETEGAPFGGTLLTPQLQFGLRIYSDALFFEIGFGAGVLLNLTQDSGRKFQWAQVMPLFNFPLAVGLTF